MDHVLCHSFQLSSRVWVMIDTCRTRAHTHEGERLHKAVSDVRTAQWRIQGRSRTRMTDARSERNSLNVKITAPTSSMCFSTFVHKTSRSLVPRRQDHTCRTLTNLMCSARAMGHVTLSLSGSRYGRRRTDEEPRFRYCLEDYFRGCKACVKIQPHVKLVDCIRLRVCF